MTPPPDLSCLTEAEKDALIVAQWRQIEGLSERIARLEAKLGGPTKGPGNSSVPPSQGHKANKPRGGGGKKRGRGHGVGSRKLAENPDRRVAARSTRCPHCRAGL